jgi:ABC exporter DevB family membrane fusion protein
MKTSIMLLVGALATILALNLGALHGRGQPAVGTSTGPQAGPLVAAAGPGRIESVSEEISVSAQVSGRLRDVMIEEGDHVEQGQVLAVIENQDYLARVRSTEAALLLRESELRRLVNGAREQERRETAATLAEAAAVLDNARLDLNRRRDLFKDGVISREEMDRAEREAQVSQARVDAAQERQRLIEAGAREEDRAGAESQVALARAQLDEARVLYEKTFIRAPISGVILRKHRKAGEAVSTQFDSPILTIADRSALRVRVDVDEVDVSKIALGQRAYVTADAFKGVRFSGRVFRVGQVLGKKTIRTDEPAERVDTKILEVLLELDKGQQLPLGLRVDAFILANGAASNKGSGTPSPEIAQ